MDVKSWGMYFCYIYFNNTVQLIVEKNNFCRDNLSILSR